MGSPHHLDTSGLAVFAIRILSAGNGGSRVVLEGELDLQTSPQLEAAVDRELADAGAVLLDLSQLQFIDSTGLHAILLLLERCRANGNRLKISSALPAQARRLFELAGVLDQLPLVDDAN